MPRVSYSDYETEVYVTVDPEWDEDIDDIYNNCSDDEVNRFIELAIDHGFEYSRDLTRTRSNDSQESDAIEKAAHVIADATDDQIASLPDEDIDMLRTKFTGVVHESTIRKNPLLDEIKLMVNSCDASPSPQLWNEFKFLISSL
jgi:hypothetical protein